MDHAPHVNVNGLASDWMAAKEEENRANARRLRIEAELIAALGQKEEGAVTTVLPTGVKVTVTGKLTYATDDMDALRAAVATINRPEVDELIEFTPRIKESVAKSVRKEHPGIWKLLAAHLTVKPAKTAVKVAL